MYSNLCCVAKSRHLVSRPSSIESHTRQEYLCLSQLAADGQIFFNWYDNMSSAIGVPDIFRKINSQKRLRQPMRTHALVLLFFSLIIVHIACLSVALFAVKCFQAAPLRLRQFYPIWLAQSVKASWHRGSKVKSPQDLHTSRFYT